MTEGGHSGHSGHFVRYLGRDRSTDRHGWKGPLDPVREAIVRAIAARKWISAQRNCPPQVS